MTQTCAQCGHRLGVGRYCANCGGPVASPETWRTDTAERPAVREEVPMVYSGTPPAPRFPLFADEAPRSVPLTTPLAPPALPYPDPQRGRGILLWLVGAVVVVAALGIHLLIGSDGSGNRADEATMPTDAGRPSPDTTRRRPVRRPRHAPAVRRGRHPPVRATWPGSPGPRRRTRPPRAGT